MANCTSSSIAVSAIFSWQSTAASIKNYWIKRSTTIISNAPAAITVPTGATASIISYCSFGNFSTGNPIPGILSKAPVRTYYRTFSQFVHITELINAPGLYLDLLFTGLFLEIQHLFGFGGCLGGRTGSSRLLGSLGLFQLAQCIY